MCNWNTTIYPTLVYHQKYLLGETVDSMCFKITVIFLYLCNVVLQCRQPITHHVFNQHLSCYRENLSLVIQPLQNNATEMRFYFPTIVVG